MNENPDAEASTDQTPDPTADPTHGEEPAKPRWRDRWRTGATGTRDRLYGVRGLVAVGLAGAVLGGLGGTALGFALDDGHHDGRPEWSEVRDDGHGDRGHRGLPPAPGVVPPVTPPDDGAAPDSSGDTSGSGT